MSNGIAMKTAVTVALVALMYAAYAGALQPLQPGELSRAIAFGEELFSDDRIRVAMVYRQVGECGGAISTCPDADLYIAYRSGDLGVDPKVYRLPAAKDWNVVGWQLDGTFQIATALPEANVDAKARSKWKPVVYDIALADMCGAEC